MHSVFKKCDCFGSFFSVLFLFMYQGDWSLTLIVIGAKDLKNVSTFGKLDPYVRVTYGNAVYKSTVIKDGGCSPSTCFVAPCYDQSGIMKLVSRVLRLPSKSKCI